jgi:hypothetical protein
MHSTRLAFAFALVALLAAACGGGSTNVQEDAGPPDETAPVVTLDYVPYHVVAGQTAVTHLATDEVAVVRAELLIDDVVVGESTQEPFTVNWDTTTVADGVHTIQVAAFDAAGNRGASPAQPLFVVNTGEVVVFDETSGLGPEFVGADFQVPEDWTTQEIDLKWHWTMPAGMNRVLAVMLFDATVGFDFNYSVGTGWCPHSGIKQAELTENDGEILLDHAPGAALTEGQWFVHVGSTNAADMKGKTASFKVRIVLLP